jgi:hypothetical protein
LPAGVGLFIGETCFLGVCFFGVNALRVSFLGVDMSLMESASLVASLRDPSGAVFALGVVSCIGVACSRVPWVSCGVLGLVEARSVEEMCFFADAVLGVVEPPVLPVFGVAAFGVTVLGVLALGVAALGVATLGVVDLGVAALVLRGSGVANFGVNALRGLCDLRCGLADTRGVSTFGACLMGVLRSCFSTLGDG